MNDLLIAVGGVLTAVVSGTVSFLVARVSTAPQERSIEAEVEHKLWERVNEVLAKQEKQIGDQTADIVRLRAVATEQSSAIQRLQAELVERDKTIAGQQERIAELEREVAYLRGQKDAHEDARTAIHTEVVDVVAARVEVVTPPPEEP